MYKSVLLFLLHCTPVVIINEFNETEGENKKERRGAGKIETKRRGRGVVSRSRREEGRI